MASTLQQWSALLPHLTIPVFLGPMAGAAGGALAAEVSRAGGHGFIGAGYLTAQQLKKELDIARDHLHSDSGKIGVGFLGWKLSSFDGKKDGDLAAQGDYATAHPQAVERIDTTLSSDHVKSIWLGFGSPKEIVFWSKVIRERSHSLRKPKDGLVLFVSVGSEEETKAAVKGTDADVLVAQGKEAGGHGLGTSPVLNTLVKQIQYILNSEETKAASPRSTAPFLLAAGGLSDGGSLATLLDSGLAGGVFGTRYLMTPESQYSAAKKGVLAAACGKDASQTTRRTMAFDEARNTLGWPARVDGRGIVNETVREYEEGTRPMEERQKRYKQAEAEDDPERVVVWSGTGIERMDAETSRKSAYDTTKLLWDEAQAALKQGPKL